MPAFSASAWSVNDSTGAGGSALSGAALAYLSSASPPNSFAARVPTVSAGSTFFQLQKSGGSPSSANHVEADLAFSVRVATHCTGPRTEIARVEGVNPINFASYGLALLVAPSGAAIELNRGPQGVTTRPLATAPALATWTRIAIHLGMDRVVTGPPTSLTVKVGEGAAESFSLDPGMGVQPYIRLGLHVSAPSGPCEVAYDNVVYDTR